MGTLGFVCPTTGREVDTGIEVDRLSFTSLHSEQFDVGFGFFTRAVPIFANLGGIVARHRLGIHDQAFFV